MAGLQALQQPEADVEQDHDRDEGNNRLQELPADRGDLKHEAEDEPGEHARRDGQSRPQPDRAAKPGVLGAYVAQEGRNDQQGLQPLAEEDGEGGQGDQRGREHPGSLQHRLNLGQALIQVPNYSLDLGYRRAGLDAAAPVREEVLHLQREVRIHDAQRDLHELKVVQVGPARQLERFLPVAGTVGLGTLLHQGADGRHFLLDIDPLSLRRSWPWPQVR